METILQVLGDMMGCKPLSFQESQEPMEVNQQETSAPYSYESSWFNPQQIPDVFSLGVDCIQPFDQPVVLLDGNRDDSMKYFATNSPCQNGQNRPGKSGIEKTEQVWQRIRWTDEMVKVLITAVSYVGEDDSPESERSQLPIKGKWRAISKTMVERGYIVSPQQCEDKFNDLNKKYKRLNEILGRGGALCCDVIKNPALMESINISDEFKDEVKKILTCKQLFYQEMCSFHNKNRKYLPHDIPLQQSVQSALIAKVKSAPQHVIHGKPTKRRKHGEDNGVASLGDTCLRGKELADLIDVCPEAIKGPLVLNQWMILRSLQLEEKKLQIEKQMLGLERKKFEWSKFCQREDRELQNMKLENELMKLENKRLAHEIKSQERGDAED